MARKTRIRKPASYRDEYFIDDPEEPGRRVQIRPDALWWLLQEGFIELYQFHAARRLQGNYLMIQIQPPKCLLVDGGNKGFGSNGDSRIREDMVYPSNRQFRGLVNLASIRGKMKRETYLFLEELLCVYVADDVVPDRNRRNWLTKNRLFIHRALLELAWASGFTTENPYAEKRDAHRLGGGRQVRERKSSRLYPGRMRAENYGDVAKVLEDEAYLRPRNRAAA
jgi:hypothetical protein